MKEITTDKEIVSILKKIGGMFKAYVINDMMKDEYAEWVRTHPTAPPLFMTPTLLDFIKQIFKVNNLDPDNITRKEEIIRKVLNVNYRVSLNRWEKKRQNK